MPSNKGCSPNVQEEERGEGWEGSRGAAGSKRLNATSHGFLPRDFSTRNLLPNHYAVTLTLPSHVASAGVARAVAKALLLYQSVSINSQTFTNKLISIYCPPPMS